jgi:2-amino-4-hydroxy-6-hydroxymethyldihydropteridine diphosphokinase
MEAVFIGVGSNIDPEKNIRKALSLLDREIRIVAISTFYRTEPAGPPGQPLFFNGVLKAETDLPPEELKNSVLRRIEALTGRRRSNDRYAPRTIDLDILLYGNLVLFDEGLVIPDPDIADRSFLAVPVSELAPDLVLPGSGVCLREIAATHTKGKLQPLGEFSRRLKKSLHIPEPGR